jgi:[ribosomal protein S18]-alanine N-acetyltransferase
VKTQSFRFRGGVARIAAWHGRADVASLALRGRGAPAPALVERVLERARAAGFRAVITNALAPAATLPLVDAGFAVKGRLKVLVHDLEGLRPPSRRTRRARRADRDAIIAVDHAAFDEFWRLDEGELRDAQRATPSSHLRVSRGPEVQAYALLGRAATDGYLQRLAVHPDAQGSGIGKDLLFDGLAWVRERGARQAFVNTQDENDRAYGLYVGAGFTPLPVGLCVLGREL